jgi:hypothetical protein
MPKVHINTHFNASSRSFSTSSSSTTSRVGVEELDQEKLTPLLRLKYHNSIADAVADLGPEEIRVLRFPEECVRKVGQRWPRGSEGLCDPLRIRG